MHSSSASSSDDGVALPPRTSHVSSKRSSLSSSGDLAIPPRSSQVDTKRSLSSSSEFVNLPPHSLHVSSKDSSGIFRAHRVKEDSSLPELGTLGDPYASRRKPLLSSLHTYDRKYVNLPMQQLIHKTLRIAKKNRGAILYEDTTKATCPFLPRSKVSSDFDPSAESATSPTTFAVTELGSIGFTYTESEFEEALAVVCPLPEEEEEGGAPSPVDRIAAAPSLECPDNEVVRGITMSGSIHDILTLKSFITPGEDSEYTHSVRLSRSSLQFDREAEPSSFVEMRNVTSIQKLPDDVLRIIFLYIHVTILSYNEEERKSAALLPENQTIAADIHSRLSFWPQAHKHHPLSGWDTMLSLSHVCRRWYLVLNYAPHWTLLRRDMTLPQLDESPMYQMSSAKCAVSQEAKRLQPFVEFYKKLVNLNKRVVTRDDIHNERLLVAICHAYVRRQGCLRWRDILREIMILLFLAAVVVGHYLIVLYIIPLIRPSVSTDGAVALIVCGVSFLLFLFGQILTCFCPEDWFVSDDRDSMNPEVHHTSCPMLFSGRPVSTVCNTVPILNLFFHLVLIIPLALVWIRIADLTDLMEREIYHPDLQACALEGVFPNSSNLLGQHGQSIAAPLTPAFIELPHPLSDPRWFLVDTGLPQTNTPRLGGTAAEAISNRSATYLQLQCATLGVGCYRLLWFDANFSSPVFAQDEPIDNFIPSSWDTNVVGASERDVADATELLLARTASSLGIYFFDSSNKTACNYSTSFENTTINLATMSEIYPTPTPWCPGGQLNGFLLALAEKDGDPFTMRISFRPPNVYSSDIRTRLHNMRAFASQTKGDSYNASALGSLAGTFGLGRTQYRGAYRRAEISSDGPRPLTDSWYGGDQLFFTNFVAVGYPENHTNQYGNVEVEVINSITPFWRFREASYLLRNGTAPVPMIVDTVPGSYSFSIETMRFRYIVGAHVCVGIIVLLMVAIGIGGLPLATRDGPTDRALWLMWGAKSFVFLFASPLTAIMFGAICITGGKSKPTEDQYLLSDSIMDGNPWLMCDNAGGVALIIVGSILTGLTFFLYCVDKITEWCKSQDTKERDVLLRELKKKLMPIRPNPRVV